MHSANVFNIVLYGRGLKNEKKNGKADNLWYTHLKFTWFPTFWGKIVILECPECENTGSETGEFTVRQNTLQKLFRIQAVCKDVFRRSQ